PPAGMEGAPDSKLVEFYLPMVNLQLNAGNTKEAERYLKIIEKHGTDFISSDPVAAYYLELLKIASDYQKTGVLSVYKIANTALLLRNVSNNLETKKKERNLAFEEAYDLSKDNYELTIKQQRMWLTIIIITLSSFIIIMFLWYMSHRRRTRLIEAEERIDTLEGLLKSANNPATDQKQGLLKKLLLQQLGIIRTFAESPTAQNQEALRKISNIGNSDTPLDTLVKWDDLYPVIDELYENFHDNLLKRYPQLFSQREVQIICLIRAGFSTKEIGVLIQQSSNSIYVSKTAIRKKLGVQPKEDFMEALTSSLTNLQKA
ncbi:MAG: LuxR C-terminal-related transcriptional regulator, partial [Muribaculaceae bacterium]|nr:LuxR C-terminal-related transcriptional regulator [Muribaculaceae bacterium]